MSNYIGLTSARAALAAHILSPDGRLPAMAARLLQRREDRGDRSAQARWNGKKPESVKAAREKWARANPEKIRAAQQAWYERRGREHATEQRRDRGVCERKFRAAPAAAREVAARA